MKKVDEVTAVEMATLTRRVKKQKKKIASLFDEPGEPKGEYPPGRRRNFHN